MKNIGKTSATSAILLFLFFSSFGFVQAQTNTDYTVLAPLPGTTKGNCGGDLTTGAIDCTTNLQTYLPGAFNLLIGLCAVLAFLVLTYGGVLYMTSDAISGKSEGKTKIENALWGLGLAIASWVILYTINPAILTFKLQMNQPTTNTQSPDILSMITTLDTGTVAPTYTMTPAQISESLADKNKLSNDSGGKINTNSALPCESGGTTGCTNLNGMPQNALTGVEDLQKGCNCNILITGGTEGGHVSHGPGDPVMDLQSNTTLNNYITSN